MRAWKITNNDTPNNVISVVLKNNGFGRTVKYIEYKKNQFFRSYALIRPQIDTFDDIMENYCGKADKDMQIEAKTRNLFDPVISQNNGSHA